MAKQPQPVPQLQPEKEVPSRQDARATGRWDARFCTRELFDYMMAKMPAGAIAADMTKHADQNSYSPRFWYQDYDFVCKDCGSQETMTAAAQQWWYEEAQGIIYSQSVLCRACRHVRRD